MVASRTEAKRFIVEGYVAVDGKIVKKPSIDVTEVNEVNIDLSSRKYVSRGGFKLEAAMDSFSISAEGRVAVDIGASTGGFTDCLLQRGARTVIAVDSGTSQLHSSLRSDERVLSFENYNARYMKPEDFKVSPSLAVMDVSFISATYIIPAVYNVLEDYGEFVCLIKPQFEVGKDNVGKGGIVKSEVTRNKAVQKVVDFARSVGFYHYGTITSPINGGDGNIEYLAYFKKNK